MNSYPTAAAAAAAAASMYAHQQYQHHYHQPFISPPPMVPPPSGIQAFGLVGTPSHAAYYGYSAIAAPAAPPY
jgi:hypothetical protein